jgi:hypothetical protein
MVLTGCAPAPTQAPAAAPTEAPAAAAAPTQAPAAAPEPTTAPAPTEPPTAVPTVAALEPTTAAAAVPAGDAAAGKLAWATGRWACKNCHGDSAEGKFCCPKLAGTVLTWDQVLSTVRSGKGGGKMPAVDASPPTPGGPPAITDQALADIYAWLKSH